MWEHQGDLASSGSIWQNLGASGSNWGHAAAQRGATGWETPVEDAATLPFLAMAPLSNTNGRHFEADAVVETDNLGLDLNLHLDLDLNLDVRLGIWIWHWLRI